MSKTSKKFYQRKDRPWLKAYLTNLESGNAQQQQVARNATSAISKVLADPLHHDFKKELPQNYKAVDVLQQYRLFFRIEEDPYIGPVVYFAWMNDEKSLHRTGNAEDCYAVFRELLEKGEIESYVPQPPTTTKETFFLNVDWGAQSIYAKLKREQNSTQSWAQSYLYLSKTQESEYKIDSITVSKMNMGLASSLIKHLCESADISKITLIHELILSDSDADKSRHLLSKSGFVLSDTIDDVEIWIRNFLNL